MLALILAAVLVPSVAANCCLPMTFEGHVFSVEATENFTFLADYSKGKFLTQPSNSSIVDFILVDLHKGKQFMKYKDGDCRAVPSANAGFYKRCVPSDAKKLGHAYFGPKGVMDVTAWRYHIDHVEITASFTKQCFPIGTVFRENGRAFTTIYTGVTDKPSDLHLLDYDVSNCRDIDPIIG